MSRPFFYISGPIFGTGPDGNIKEFQKVARLAEVQLDCEALIPHDMAPEYHPGPCPAGRKSEGAEHSAACHLKADIRNMLMCKGIVLLAGWHVSQGAQLEMQVASHCGLEVHWADTNYKIHRIC